MAMELLAAKAEETRGVVAFLSPGDLSRLRRASTAATALAQRWWKYCPVHLDPERQLRAKGEDPDENRGFLDSLAMLSSHGARVRGLVLPPLFQALPAKRDLCCDLLSRVSAEPLWGLFVRRNAAAVLGSALSAAEHSALTLRRLHLDILPGGGVRAALRRRLFTALQGRRLEELSIRPAGCGFSAADMEEIPSGIQRLELLIGNKPGLDVLAAWLGSTGSRATSQLRLIWDGGAKESWRYMDLHRLAAAFPNMEKLSLVRLYPQPGLQPGSLAFRTLKGLVFEAPTNWGGLAPGQDPMGNAAGDALASLLRALPADAQRRLQSLALDGEIGFHSQADFELLGELGGLGDLRLDGLVSVDQRSIDCVLKESRTLERLTRLERLSVTLLYRGGSFVWPYVAKGDLNSVIYFLRRLLTALCWDLPPALRGLHLGARPSQAALPVSIHPRKTKLANGLGRLGRLLHRRTGKLRMDLAPELGPELFDRTGPSPNHMWEFRLLGASPAADPPFA